MVGIGKTSSQVDDCEPRFRQPDMRCDAVVQLRDRGAASAPKSGSAGRKNAAPA
jgi:hypothetical protein